MSTQGELTGRVAVVTGGGSGIGRAIALALSQRGANVIVVGRREETLRETCAADSSGKMRVVVADVTRDDWFGDLDSAAPAVDILVNNAAEFAAYGKTPEVGLDEFDRVCASIVRASWATARHVLPGMSARGFGRIVNIGSIVASLGAPRQSAYVTAKSALVGLTRSLAAEAGPSGVTCNLVEPGLIRTARIEETLADKAIKKLVRSTPVARIGEVDDVANAVCFLVSEDASFITGTTLQVSGGLGLGFGSAQAND